MPGRYDDIFQARTPFNPPPITFEESELLANSHDSRQAAIDMAYRRADAQLDAEPPYPGLANITQAFPGINPKGKFTQFDTEAYARLTAIRDALPTRPREVRDFVQPMLEQLTQKGTEMSSEFKIFRDQCRRLRRMERAAQLAPTKNSHDMLETMLPRLEDEIPQSTFMRTLRVLDYVAGTSDRVPTKDEIDMAVIVGGNPYPKKIEQLRAVPSRPPESLTLAVHFQNFDEIAAHQFFLDPKNWGKTEAQAPNDISNLDAGTVAINKYAAATVDRTMQPLFHGIEHPGANASNSLDRGGLVTVDGKTIRSYMQERYSGNPEQFDNWYHYNVREMTNQIVSAGLMAGKRVEAFVPDANGNLPKEPTQLTKTGYEPSPVKKVTLNAWERHFSKYGFFKKKSAKAAEYQRIMEGRAEMKANYALGYSESKKPAKMENLFFGDYKNEHGMDPDVRLDNSLSERGLQVGAHFRMSRSAHIDACAGLLIAEGHSIRDVFDPNKLQAERQALGKQYMEKALEHDHDWLGQTCYKGMKAILAEADQVRRTYDLCDRSQLIDAMPWLGQLAQSGKDLCQEAEHVMEGGFKAARADDPLHSSQAYNRVTDAVDSLALFYQYSKDELALSIPPLVNEEVGNRVALERIIQGSVFREILKDKTEPDFFRRINNTSIAAVLQAPLNPVAAKLSKQMTEDPLVSQAVRKMAQVGELQKHLGIKLKPDMVNGQPRSITYQVKNYSLTPGPDGKEVFSYTNENVKGTALTAVVTPSEKLTAALDKKVNALKLQEKSAELEAKKNSRQKETKADQPQKEAKKESPKKTAPKKTAPVKNHGGLKL